MSRVQVPVLAQRKSHTAWKIGHILWSWQMSISYDGEVGKRLNQMIPVPESATMRYHCVKSCHKLYISTSS